MAEPFIFTVKWRDGQERARLTDGDAAILLVVEMSKKFGVAQVTNLSRVWARYENGVCVN